MRREGQPMSSTARSLIAHGGPVAASYEALVTPTFQPIAQDAGAGLNRFVKGVVGWGRRIRARAALPRPAAVDLDLQ